jgi:hypothetical protein
MSFSPLFWMCSKRKELAPANEKEYVGIAERTK